MNSLCTSSWQLVVADNPGCGGWRFAVEQGIAVLQFPSKKHPPGAHAVALEQLPGALQAAGVDFICLAGFLKVRRCAIALVPQKAAALVPQRTMSREQPPCSKQSATAQLPQ